MRHTVGTPPPNGNGSTYWQASFAACTFLSTSSSPPLEGGNTSFCLLFDVILGGSLRLGLVSFLLSPAPPATAIDALESLSLVSFLFPGLLSSPKPKSVRAVNCGQEIFSLYSPIKQQHQQSSRPSFCLCHLASRFPSLLIDCNSDPRINHLFGYISSPFRPEFLLQQCPSSPGSDGTPVVFGLGLQHILVVEIQPTLYPPCQSGFPVPVPATSNARLFCAGCFLVYVRVFRSDSAGQAQAEAIHSFSKLLSTRRRLGCFVCSRQDSAFLLLPWGPDFAPSFSSGTKLYL